MAQTTDGALTLSLLKSALAIGRTEPDLEPSQVTDLFNQAAVAVLDEEGNPATGYTTASLNAAAAQGWRWKAAIASSGDAGFDEIRGSNGKGVKRSVGLTERWQRFAADYASGKLDVLGGIVPDGRRASGSIGMISSLAAEFPL